MLQVVSLMVIMWGSEREFYVMQAEKWNIFSEHPIVRCITEQQKTFGSKGETVLHHLCNTEGLYAEMTGIKSVEITQSGLYDI